MSYPIDCEHTCPRCAHFIAPPEDHGRYARFHHEIWNRREERDCPGEDRLLCDSCQGEMTDPCWRCGHARADHWQGFDDRLILVADCAEAPCAKCGCTAELEESGLLEPAPAKCA